MIIRIFETNETYECDLSINKWRTIIRLSGENLPKTPPNDFELIDNGIIIDSFYGFSIVYDEGEGYIEYTNDEETYYNYFILDEENYVKEVLTLTDKINLFVYQYGQGKKYAECSLQLYDENQIPLYKVVDNELIILTEEERLAIKSEKDKLYFKKVMEDKIAELSITCQQVIYAGTDVILSNGTKHYSFTLSDQANINNLYTTAVLTKTDGIPYHADNDLCELYTYLDIIRLNKAMQEYILYNTTYFNMLKAMVSKLTSIDEINTVVYGTELSDEYITIMNDILTQSQAMFVNTLTVYDITLEELAII